jgi:acetyl esterase/lipase
MDHGLCCAVSAEQNLTVLNVEYRLAPEYPFPTPPDDAYAALKWVRDREWLFHLSTLLTGRLNRPSSTQIY